MSCRPLLPLAVAALLLTPALPGRAQEPAAPTVSSPAAAAPSTPTDATAATDANKALVRRYIEEALSGGDLKVLDQLVAADYVDSSSGGAENGHGPEAVRTAQGRVRALFKDIRYHVDVLVAEGDKVVAHYTVRAVRKLDPEVDAGDAGREMAIQGMTIFRLASGRIAETWTINDQLGMFRQLGYALASPKEQQKAKGAAKPQ
jgi:predicted ester cyclase